MGERRSQITYKGMEGTYESCLTPSLAICARPTKNPNYDTGKRKKSISHDERKLYLVIRKSSTSLLIFVLSLLPSIYYLSLYKVVLAAATIIIVIIITIWLATVQKRPSVLNPPVFVGRNRAKPNRTNRTASQSNSSVSTLVYYYRVCKPQEQEVPPCLPC